MFYTDALAATIMQRDFGVRFAKYLGDDFREIEIKLEPDSGHRGITGSDIGRNDFLKIVFTTNLVFKIGDDGDWQFEPHWKENIIPPILYIHPDSLPIFQPQVGDVLFLKNTGSPYEDDIGESIVYSKTINKNYLNDFDELKIIMRNGKPFFMPIPTEPKD